jgi:hypothetical protein
MRRLLLVSLGDLKEKCPRGRLAAATWLVFRGSRSAADFVWTSGSARALAPSVQAPTRGFGDEHGWRRRRRGTCFAKTAVLT